MTGTTLHTVSRIISSWEQRELVAADDNASCFGIRTGCFGLAEGEPAACVR